MNMNYIKIYLLLFITLQTLYAQNGVIKTYSIDRKLESEVSYINDLYDGTSYWYYPNGNIQKEINYSEGKVNGWVREYYESGLLKEEYFVNNGVKDGNVKLFYENGGLKEVITYNKGEFVSTEKVGFDKNYIAPPDAYSAGNRQYEIQKKQDNILCEIEICPVPIGGMSSIEKNIVYPEHAKLYGLEGIVTLLVNISENGEVQSSQVIKGIGLGCDEAAIDAIKKTKFMPGQNENKFVSAQISISIPFILNEKSEFAINYRRHRPVKTSQIKAARKEEKAEVKKETFAETVQLQEVVEKVAQKKSAEVLEYKIMTGSFANMECDATIAWMVPRRLEPLVRERLGHLPAVALLGPRQVGKTTLAHRIADGRDSVYLDLESPRDREKLSDPLFYLAGHEDRLVVLDEVQRVPELFATLRGVIDTGRRRGRKSGRFLLLGSASADLLRQSETLAGRIAYLEANEAKDYKSWLSSLKINSDNIISTAKSLMGLPYLWGGTSVKGVDCSGYTKTVFFLNGILLPRDASQQAHVGELIDTKDGFDNFYF